MCYFINTDCSQAYKGKGQQINTMECSEDEVVPSKGKRSFDAMEDSNSTESDTVESCLEEQESSSKEDGMYCM